MFQTVSCTQGILNPDFMDKKRVDVAVRDQKSVSGRVWARMVHSKPIRKSPALDADAEAAARAVNLEPPSRRQEISGAWEINPYKFVSPIY